MERNLRIPWVLSPLSTLRLRNLETGQLVPMEVIAPDGCIGMMLAFASPDDAEAFAPGKPTVEFPLDEITIQ